MTQTFAAVTALVLFLLGSCAVNAHDKWANGVPIPEWVKHKCCNANEAVELGMVERVHPITAGDQVTGFKVDGFDDAVPIIKVYPSQDGHVWAFYNHTDLNGYEIKDVSDKTIYCLFVPCFSRVEDDPQDPMPKDLDTSCS